MADKKVSEMTAASTLGVSDQFLLTQGGESKSLLWSVLRGALPLTLVGEAIIAGSAGTQLDVSGFSLSADQALIWILGVDNAGATTPTLSLYYNSDTTAANYNVQTLTSASTTNTGLRVTTGVIATFIASEGITGFGLIYPDVDGRPRSTFLLNRSNAAAIALTIGAHIRNNTENITSLSFVSSSASTLSIGSYVRVFKLKY